MMYKFKHIIVTGALALAMGLGSIHAQVSNQSTFRREIEVLDARGHLRAYRRSVVVYTDAGVPVETCVQKKGTVVDRGHLAKGEWLVVHEYGLKVYHGTEPIVTEVGEVSTGVPIGAPSYSPPMWLIGSNVSVSIDSTGFTSEQVGAIQRALDAWNMVAPVQFKLVGAEGQIRIRRATQELLVAQAYTEKLSVGDVLISAQVFINPFVRSADAMQSTLAHELGHTLGLSDCTSCKSIMTAKSKGAGRSNGYSGPTAVDVEVLEAVRKERA